MSDVLELIKGQEKYFRKEEPYYITSNKEIPNTLKELILFLLYEWNGYKTYDKQDSLICLHKERRTSHDIFLICRNYIGEHITLEEVIRNLVELHREDKVRTFTCFSIEKRVWMRTSTWADLYSGNDAPDELGLYLIDYLETFKEEKISQ